MKYKVLKDIPWFKSGEIIDENDESRNYHYYYRDFPDFFEPIEEKPKTIWDLNYGDKYYEISAIGLIYFNQYEHNGYDFSVREISNAFLTKQEAELELRIRTLLTSLLKKKHEGGYGKKWVNTQNNYIICINFYNELELENTGSSYYDSPLGYFTYESAQKFIKENETELKEYFNILMKINELK